MIVNGALSNALLQHLVPDELRGRMMAAYSFIVVGLSQVVGSFVAGTVADTIGVAWSIGLGAALLLAFATWAFGFRTDLRSL